MPKGPHLLPDDPGSYYFKSQEKAVGMDIQFIGFIGNGRQSMGPWIIRERVF
jgi:hypothetical protein